MILDTIELVQYNESLNSYVKQLLIDDNSKYVKQVEERLNKKISNTVLGNGFLVKLQDKIIGYVYFSPISNYRLYLEYSVLKSERKKGYGKLILNEVTNYVIQNYNIKQIMLDIDRSNLASMNTAISCGYNYDDDTIGMNDRIEFILDNPYFINKKNIR